jgi:glucose/mannose-6-phosphate isomerase
MGGSGIAGDVLAAVAGPTCPVPVVTHRGYGLPGWVGPVDLVVAVSCSGSTRRRCPGWRRRCVAAAG